RLYPASITKILTALVAIENGDLTSTITMSHDSVYGIEPGSSHIGLDEGEQINFEDALYAMMLVSANEAAWAIAEHVGGSLSHFCEMMNERAKELGCTDTHFVNANGLHDDEHYTCAYDMALIAREAIKNEEFIKLTSTMSHTIPATNKNEQRDIYQDNRMLKSSTDYYYQYCLGGKTGFTNEAGGTLVTWAQKDDMKLICVVMHSNSNASNYLDSAALYDYCFNNFKEVKPLEGHSFSDSDLESAEKYLDDYYGGENLGTLELSVDQSVKFTVPNGVNTNNLKIEFKLSTDKLQEWIIGTIIVGDDTTTYIETPVRFSGYIDSNNEEVVAAAIAEGIIEEPKSKKKSNVLPIILVIILVLGATVAGLYIRIQYVNKQREEYKKKRDEARKNKRSF
ncbi:MAG: D-alanyl-D-alanine carboxypeptidase family protein, partial [Wujia sp.]